MKYFLVIGIFLFIEVLEKKIKVGEFLSERFYFFKMIKFLF